MSRKQDLQRLRELSEQELLDEIKEAKSELFNLNFQWAATRQLSNPSRLGVLRKKIARVHTILREREISSALQGKGETVTHA
ncbi:MAG: 50S ribosomal protein L29 [Candidatus Sericytochromatia bacterium]